MLFFCSHQSFDESSVDGRLRLGACRLRHEDLVKTNQEDASKKPTNALFAHTQRTRERREFTTLNKFRPTSRRTLFAGIWLWRQGSCTSTCWPTYNRTLGAHFQPFRVICLTWTPDEPAQSTASCRVLKKSIGVKCRPIVIPIAYVPILVRPGGSEISPPQSESSAVATAGIGSGAFANGYGIPLSISGATDADGRLMIIGRRIGVCSGLKSDTWKDTQAERTKQSDK